MFAVTLALGDQRELGVLLTTPGEGEAVPATVREIAVTFGREPDHEALEDALSFEPEVAGSVRWRGRTLVFIPEVALLPGEYTLRIGAGKLGRGSEPMREDFLLRFAVREPGIATIVTEGDRQDLVELRPDGTTRILVSAPRIGSSRWRRMARRSR